MIWRRCMKWRKKYEGGGKDVNEIRVSGAWLVGLRLCGIGILCRAVPLRVPRTHGASLSIGATGGKGRSGFRQAQADL